jgi:antitoxin ChpS
MLAVPPALLQTLGLSAGSEVEVSANAGCLVIEPDTRPRYSLEELLSPHTEVKDFFPDDKEWLESLPVGRELL